MQNAQFNSLVEMRDHHVEHGIPLDFRGPTRRNDGSLFHYDWSADEDTVLEVCEKELDIGDVPDSRAAQIMQRHINFVFFPGWGADYENQQEDWGRTMYGIQHRHAKFARVLRQAQLQEKEAEKEAVEERLKVTTRAQRMARRRVNRLEQEKKDVETQLEEAYTESKKADELAAQKLKDKDAELKAKEITADNNAAVAMGATEYFGQMVKQFECAAKSAKVLSAAIKEINAKMLNTDPNQLGVVTTADYHLNVNAAVSSNLFKMIGDEVKTTAMAAKRQRTDGASSSSDNGPLFDGGDDDEVAM